MKDTPGLFTRACRWGALAERDEWSLTQCALSQVPSYIVYVTSLYCHIKERKGDIMLGKEYSLESLYFFNALYPEFNKNVTQKPCLVAHNSKYQELSQEQLRPA